MPNRILHPASGEPGGWDGESVKGALVNHLVYTVGKDARAAKERDWLSATAALVRDRLVERWIETARRYDRDDVKRVYYLSVEFLLGRLLTDGLRNIGLYDVCREALAEVGVDLEEVAELEFDAALGHGGLGRLAACLLDSMATVGVPGYGYGIRYEYGVFAQHIENGWQLENPENWLRYGNPWEFPRPEVLHPVKFYGRVEDCRDESGRSRRQWVDGETVLAMAYDVPVPGYRSPTVNTLRLWSAKAAREFDLHSFNQGDYIRALEKKNESENLSRVLYPSDMTDAGQELRFKQEYFFTSASVQDILRRHKAKHETFDTLPDKAALQINDTHPALAVTELMRLLVDAHGVDWDRAWEVTRRTVAYTNHTLMPEALETWPVRFFETMLPRHLEIIGEINRRFLRHVRGLRPGADGLLGRVSLIDKRGEPRVRMAHLAIVGSHAVNGVSEIHTRLMRETTFADFDRLFPGKFVNVTNGITPRRWLGEANPGLARLISSRIGDGWLRNLEELEGLAALAEDAAFQEEFRAVKRANKEALAARIAKQCGVAVDAGTLFDVQVKRIHEYKRQLLNVLHVVTLYDRIRSDPARDRVPRTVLFAGKAAPAYAMAKLIVKLIHDVAAVVNDDPAVGGLLKVAFLPNYGVSQAQRIVSAAELSQQISTAGTEACGTGNMKLALNGALTIGTLDGANIEIRDAVGGDNMFTFGLTADEAAALKANGYDPWRHCHENPALKAALDMIASGRFSPREPGLFRPIVDALTHGGDHFLVLADYASYLACQERVEALYRDEREWTRRAVLNVARMGRFSSDRTVREYAKTVWQVAPDGRQTAPKQGPSEPEPDRVVAL
jgi:starch phosphorylase